MNVGIIGAGGIARKLHIPQLMELADQGVRVTHLAGRSRSRLERLAQDYDVKHLVSDYRDMLADDSVDAVVIALPHPLHVSAGLDALAAGKHVMMQKPLCGDIDEANAFAAEVESTDVTVYALPHYGAEIEAVRRSIRSGEIGKLSGAYCRVSHGGPEVYYAEIRDYFGEQADDGDLWFFRSGEASVGALFDMGVYAVGVLVAVMGSVTSVIGHTATIDKPTELEDTATLLLRFESGALGTAETGWCDPAKSTALSVHGTRGKITMPGVHGQGIMRWEPGSYTREDEPAIPHKLDVDGTDSGSAHRQWLDCIRQGRQPELCNVSTARHITEVLLAGLESSRTGTSQKVHSRM